MHRDHPMELRPFRPEDADWVQEELQRSGTTRWLSGPPHPYPARGAADWIATHPQLEARGRRVRAVVLDGRPLGAIELRTVADPRCTEVGLWIAEAARGHGHGRRAVERALAEDEAHGHVRPWAVARVAEGNAASQALFRTLGFRPQSPVALDVPAGRVPGALWVRPRGSGPRGPLPLPYTGPWLLAPMEGVTEPLFRRLVLDLHSPESLGGACTEFARVSNAALPRRVLKAHLGEPHAIPVALQLMGSDLEHLCATAERAVQAGAPVLDLNFGCPAKGALKGCAGSALLDQPDRLREIVRAVADAVGDQVPVTAKLRAGGEAPDAIGEIVEAACAGGASLITMHARTRVEAYSVEADWSRLEQAQATAAAQGVPLCGNGGVRTHEDLARLQARVGCAFVMVGQGALGDPWVFSGQEVTRSEAATFLLRYGEGLQDLGASPRGAAARVKQLLGHWRAGGLVPGENERLLWLRERDPAALFQRLRDLTGDVPGRQAQLG